MTHYIEKPVECEACGAEIYAGYYAIEEDYNFFCDDDCHYEYYKKMNDVREVFLTDEKER